MRVAVLLLAVGCVLLAPVLGQGQSSDSHGAKHVQVRAGDIAFANSGSKAAQAPFLEGLALLHDFEYERAAGAFRRAETADPSFAMAYWGEAMTHNHGIWMEQDLPAARAVLSKLGSTPDARRAKTGTARERAYLGALEILYGDGTKEARDFRYADAMQVVHATYPSDVDATAFYALSLLGTCHSGRDFAVYMKAAALLEVVYPSHLRHPGVLHYLIHSYDDPIHAPLGRRAAERYGALAPDAPHALHMTSHIFLALGMWDDVITANLQAIAAGNAYTSHHGHAPKGCGHYPTWLMYGYLQEGRSAAAVDMIAVCRQSATALPATTPASFDPDRSAISSYVYMRLLQVVETGNASPIESLNGSSSGNESPAFFAAYADAVTALRIGDLPQLNAAVATLAQRQVPLLSQLAAGGDEARTDRESVNVIVNQMSAVARIRSGDTEGGLVSLRKAADAESAMAMEFGPPMVALPSWELLGEELLRAQKPADAERAFRNALARAPGRTRSLRGLLQSEQLTGDTAGAAATQLELARYPRKAH